MHKIKSALIYILLILTSCISTQNMTEIRAFEIAENYVMEQGYSDKKMDLNKTKINFDVLDQYRTPEQVIEWRHNLLKPRAVYSNKVENGWIIGFEYKNEKFNKIHEGIRFGKGVWVSENGKEIFMFHENIGFQ